MRDQCNELGSTAIQIYKSLTDTKYNIGVFRSLSEAIAQFQPHLIHAWLPASVTIPAMILAAMGSIPCLWSYRSAMFFNRPLAIIEHLLAWSLVSRIISNNHINQSTAPYRALFRMKGGVLIPNAVHVGEQHWRKHTLPSSGKKRNILFVGRLVQSKNWQCIIQALPAVLRAHNAQLLICGEGEDADQIHAMCGQLQLREYVSILGYRQDIYRMMQESDVFVQPSLYEGMSNVFLEALAVGVPCVVSDIPSNRDIIKNTHCALTFNPSSSDELAGHIIRILGSPDLVTSLSQAGLAVARTYSVELLAIRHAAVYHEVVASASPKGRSFHIR